MNRKLSYASAATGLVVGLVGLLNVVLGIMAVVSGAFPSMEGKIITPPIGVGSIFFGLLMMVAGAAWVVSGVGYFIRREWSPALALYTSPVIVAINLAGVLHLWGFVVNIGWAALSTVAGVASIWYLSKKELASFFLISVAEHVVLLIVFAMLIYAEPVGVAESENEYLNVTLEKIEQQEPVPPEVIPRRKAELEKQPALPKIEIQNIATTDPGTEIADPAPQPPKTLVRVRDTGEDTILRSPGFKEREQRLQDTIPTLDVGSVAKTSKKPSLDIGPSERSKDNPETRIARPPEYIRDDLPSPDERVGPSQEVAKPSFAGEISGEIAGRKVVFWPKTPEGYKGTEGGTATIKFWVDPAGSVIRVEISKKSGSPRLDTMAMEYVKLIRFVELPEDVQQRIQWGVIPIDFELTREAG